MAEQDPKHQQRIRAVEFHPEAQAELRADARFYEERQAGLGDEFLDAVDWVIRFVKERPAAGRSVGAGIRRALTRRFRYAVIYREVGDRLEVLAVAHLRRRPGYWHDRT